MTKATARHIWLAAQRLDVAEPFGDGPEATRAAIEHLGYVQIDTINVIERCHHHILYTRIPGYRREHLHQAQTVDKSVFEYWTHALSYLPARDLRFFLATMRRYRQSPDDMWFGPVKTDEVRKILRRIRKEGPLTIRDIDDDVLVDKVHPWASRKPSKRALQAAFYAGLVTVGEREGMLKTYELMDRHFGWNRRPKAASERDEIEYLVERALRSQGIVSLASVCFLKEPRKQAILGLIHRKVHRKELVPVAIEGGGKTEHWVRPEAIETPGEESCDVVHILSPFDPLVIQRKRLRLFFDYEHVFEAYVPKPKRRFGYFALPVLVGDQIVAAIDIKTDRDKQKLLLQKWTWVGKGAAKSHRVAIDAALHRFERFQLGL